MGLEEKLLTKGSALSKANGGSIATPVGATKESKLQYEYSINGVPNIPMEGYLTNYKTKPTPSKLDIDGKTPTSPLSSKPQLGDGYKNGTYKNSAPADAAGRI
jgi:hypothetical protein